MFDVDLYKYGLLVASFAWLTFGIAEIIIGIYTMTGTGYSITLSNMALDNQLLISETLDKAYIAKLIDRITLALGVVTIPVATLGVLTFLSSQISYYQLHLLILGFILVLQAANAALAYIYSSDIQSTTQLLGLKMSLSRYYVGLPFSLKRKSKVSLAWDYIMITNRCCGLFGSSDFTGTSSPPLTWYHFYRQFKSNKTFYYRDEVVIPVSCCRFRDTKFATDGTWLYLKQLKNDKCVTGSNYHFRGCKDFLMAGPKRQALLILGSNMSGVCLEVAILAMGMSYVRNTTRVDTDDTLYVGEVPEENKEGESECNEQMASSG